MEKSEKKPHILYHLTSIAMGGMEDHTLILARAIRREGYPVSVIVPSNPIFDNLSREFFQSNINVYRYCFAENLSIISFLKKSILFFFLLKKLDVNVFHQQRGGPFMGKWVCLIARLARIPVVIVSEHQPLVSRSYATSWLNTVSDRFVDCILVDSNHDRALQLKNSNRSPEKVMTVYCGVDVENFRELAGTRDQKAFNSAVKSENGPIIGTVARLEKQKGITHFLDAIEKLSVDWPSIKIIIIGDGSERIALEEKADYLGIRKKVTFLGYRTDIAPLINFMDVFVLPSEWESFGLVLVEAMALAKPIVASRVGGIPEVVTDGKTGLLVPAHDPLSLSSAIGSLLSDERKRLRMGLKGNCRAKLMFTDRIMSEKMIKLYERLHNRSQHPIFHAEEK